MITPNCERGVTGILDVSSPSSWNVRGRNAHARRGSGSKPGRRSGKHSARSEFEKDSNYPGCTRKSSENNTNHTAYGRPNRRKKTRSGSSQKNPKQNQISPTSTKPFKPPAKNGPGKTQFQNSGI